MKPSYVAHHHPAQEGSPDSNSHDGHRSSTGHETLQEVKARFEVVKAQHASLVKVMQESLNESAQHMVPLPATVEEEETVEHFGQRTSTPVTRKSFRDSIASTSDSVMEWFDAVDEGPQEFIMELGQDLSEPGSRLLSTSAETSSIDTDFESSSASEPLRESVSSGTAQIVRRTQLPCLPPSDEGSLFTILKKNVGKVSYLVAAE